MSNITAGEVKRLRDATGAGMMDAKKALVEAEGDFDAAVETLRIKGAARAAKRSAERTAADGLVANKDTALIELACETDFVAKNADFQQLAADIVSVAADVRPADVDELNAASMPDGRTVSEAVASAAAVIGEKIELRRVAVFGGNVVSYLHQRSPDLPAQVGILLEYTGGDESVAREAAMQVAALKAQYVTRDDVPAEVVENERRIAEATAKEEGKPEQALPKIVEGRVNGFFKETVLVDQPWVKDSKTTVASMLADANVSVTRFVRFEAGA